MRFGLGGGRKHKKNGNVKRICGHGNGELHGGKRGKKKGDHKRGTRMPLPIEKQRKEGTGCSCWGGRRSAQEFRKKGKRRGEKDG